MFAAITPLLITGAFSERVPFGSFVAFIVLWSLFIYYPVCHWVWGGGFLSTLWNDRGAGAFSGMCMQPHRQHAAGPSSKHTVQCAI